MTSPILPDEKGSSASAAGSNDVMSLSDDEPLLDPEAAESELYEEGEEGSLFSPKGPANISDSKLFNLENGRLYE